MNKNHRKSEKGFTLVELLVALALAGIVSTAIYGSFISQEKVYKAQQLVAEMQQNARAAMLIVTKEARMINAYLGNKGIGYWDSVADEEKFIDGIKAYNNYNNEGYDVIDIAYANFDVSTPIQDKMPKASSTLKVKTVEGFEEDMLVVISDGVHSNLMWLTQVQDTGPGDDPDGTLQHNPANDNINYPASKEWDHDGYDVGAMIFLAKFISFKIDTSDADHPTLGISINYDPDGDLADRDYFPLVNDIEDFQIAYILDDGTIVNEPADDEYDDIVSIRFTIVARTRVPVNGFPGSAPLDIEDHDVTNTQDSYHRRVLSEEILVRNFQI